MIQRLKRNLYFLLIGSLMFIFSIVFCLMIHENIKAKKKSELAYFNRMATTVVLQLEHESDYETCLNLYEEQRDMYFQVLSNTGHSLYQSEYLKNNTDVIDTFLTTLLNTEGDFTLSSSSLSDNYYSRQSGVYTIKAINGKNYYSSYSSTKKADVKISKPKLKNVALSNGTSVKISWQRDSKVDGYEIYRSTNGGKTYKLLKKITRNSTVSYTDKKVSRGKTYYYKIRKWKKVNKKTYRSGYSAKQSVKIG